MRGSLLILILFIIGVLVGLFIEIPQHILDSDFSLCILYGLMFTVGLGIGYDKTVFETLKSTRLKIVLVPLATLFGTLIGTAIVSLCIPQYNVWECMAVGSGLGYYSLSSIFITQYKGAELGTIALVSNIIRELFTLLAAPLLVVWFGKLAPISSAGVTSIDTALPVINKFSGPEFVVIALFHGIVLEVCIPFLVTFFCYL